MYELLGVFRELSADLSKMPVSMIPNILQLTGAVLTLITALLTSLDIFENARSKIRHNLLRRMHFENEEHVESLKSEHNDLRTSIRELSYGITGIFLIILGYIAAAIGLDYKDNFILYLLAPIIVLLFSILVAIYWKDLVSIVSSALCLLLIIYLMYVSKWFAVIISFLGSTTFLMLVVISFLESSIINRVIGSISREEELIKLLKNKNPKAQNKSLFNNLEDIYDVEITKDPITNKVIINYKIKKDSATTQENTDETTITEKKDKT
ncbi:hypothetical protein [Bacillus pseudomycoides]|uniref:hypothetical protein n=1 Tax=Bacillus pseudomycoides TaxID=64104 RepID=UPI000BF803BA|nr:hypothetical protein [Bacillus pseudomycoides]PEP87426.1 hypothetical protein CN584_04475 [Bacillus pseudomycoides]PGF08952.1 hypothetical protein COM59_10870 [Bacillus pseudomycoides]